MDLLRAQIYAAAKANDSEAVLLSIDKYRKIGLDFPVPLLWIEAKAAHDSGDAPRALRALGEFLAKTDRGSEQYKEALALYPTYEHGVASQSQQQIDARRQAMAAKIPDAISQMQSSLVPVQESALRITSKLKDHMRMVQGGDVNVWNRNGVAAGSREVKVKRFQIMSSAVTNFWWDVFAADTGRASTDDWKGSQSERSTFLHGAQGVSDDVVAFAVWLSSRTHERWRLPSEAEIESIARYETSLYPSTYPNEGEHLVVSLGTPNGTKEFVGDCWHATWQGAPTTALPWTSSCESHDNLALSMEVRFGKRQKSGKALWEMMTDSCCSIGDIPVATIIVDRTEYVPGTSENGKFQFRLIREE